LQLGQPAPVEHRYSATGMQQAKLPLQQQNTIAAAAALAAAEAVAAAEHSLVEKQASPAAPAGINSSQLRAAGQGLKSALAQAAAQRKRQEQSSRLQARAAATAPAVQAPMSSTVDLTGDAD
jgi:hypothetical protein